MGRAGLRADGEPMKKGDYPEKSGDAEAGEREMYGARCPGNPNLPDACCTILQSIGEGVFTIDLTKKVTFLNRAAESITGFSSPDAVGQYCFDIFRSNVCQVNCPLDDALTSGKALHDVPAVIINRTGREVPINLTADILRDSSGKVVGAVEIFRDLSPVETLRDALSNRHRLGDIISRNDRMRDIFEILPDLAESGSTVLIQGPSGSGKEVVANTIHDLSLRKGHPFVKINCAAIPDTLLESELFGYARGAFTDARKDKPGRFVLADKGTLFLDEVGDMSPAMQVKLLRALEEKQFIPLGGTVPLKADVRIIAATNRSLKDLVDEKLFREDLYYRLNIITIDLPPLCERAEDIPLLTEHFVSRLNALKGRTIVGLSEEAMGMLMNHDFPGNVRELENILEHAYVLCKGALIEPRHLPVHFLERFPGQGRAAPAPTALASSEALTIRKVLEKHGGNKVRAARELGIGRSTLWRKMKQLKLT